MTAIGHRGAPRLERENTLESFAAAAERGAQWIETDVRVTADGVAVLVHDRTLTRLWGDERRVDELTAAQLAAVGRRDGRYRIPRLEEALAASDGWGSRLLLDVSCPEEGRAALAPALRTGRLDQVAFTGDPATMAEIRAAAPESVIAMTCKQAVLPSDGLLDAVRPDYFNQEHSVLDARLIDQLHGRGLRVSTYTVDDRHRMAELIRAGVDAIISNDIEALVGVIGAIADELPG